MMIGRGRAKRKPQSLDAVLRATYYDPKRPGSYGGVLNLWREVRKKRPTVKKSDVEAWLAKQDTYTLHKPVRYKFTRKKVVVGGIDHQWQADLADVGSIHQQNPNSRYLLTCIDVFSKYAWVVPVKKKSGSHVAEAFESIFREGRKPQTLQTDQGTEFLNSTVQALLKKERIHFFTTYNVETKASVVERFNRTLKTRMWRYFTENNTKHFEDVLPSLVHAYNHTFHRSIGRTPAEVSPENEELVWLTLYGGLKQSKRKKRRDRRRLQPGDWVRINKSRRTFKKGYLPNWTEELFGVVRVLDGDPPTYILQDYSGTTIEGSFYMDEIQKVDKVDSMYLVEEVLDERAKKGGGKEVLVRWVGYSKKFDSWIDKKWLQDYKKRRDL